MANPPKTPANSECAHCGGPATCFGSYCNDYGCRERAYCDGCCNHSEARIGFCAHGVDRKCSLAPSPAPAAEPVRAGDGACSECVPEACHSCALTTVAELRAEVARLTGALIKINAIRSDIVKRQSLGWSAHIYPLVAALDEAGFKYAALAPSAPSAPATDAAKEKP